MKRSYNLIHQIAYSILNWGHQVECGCPICQKERDDAWHHAFKEEEE